MNGHSKLQLKYNSIISVEAKSVNLNTIQITSLKFVLFALALDKTAERIECKFEIIMVQKWRLIST
jgi:hypothetical protein